MIARSLLAGFLFVFTVGSSSQSIAFEGEFLSSQKLQEAYRHFCATNVSELKTLLQNKKTKVQGTDKLVVETYSDMLKCDYQTNLLYKDFEDPVWLERTEDAIRERGKEKHIEVAIRSLDRTKEKRKIDLLLDLAGSNTGLSENELRLVITFAEVKAGTDALVSVLRSQSLQ